MISEVPKVVCLHKVKVSSPEFWIRTGIVSSAKLNKIHGADASFASSNPELGSKSASISSNGRFQSGMCAGLTIVYPAGTETVSVATARKTELLSTSFLQWYRGTWVLSSNCMRSLEISGSHLFALRKSNPIRQSALAASRTWNSWTYSLGPFYKREANRASCCDGLFIRSNRFSCGWLRLQLFHFFFI